MSSRITKRKVPRRPDVRDIVNFARSFCFGCDIEGRETIKAPLAVPLFSCSLCSCSYCASCFDRHKAWCEMFGDVPISEASEAVADELFPFKPPVPPDG